MPLYKLTVNEYLAWENDQPDRHEFFKGETFDMVGGGRGHGRVIANLMRHLGNHLDDSPCQAFSENMKVQIGNDAVLYPDVFVTCDKHFSDSQLVFTMPLVVIEVLSPTTQRYDRSEKFAIYRKLASMREYVLIDPDTCRVEVFRPKEDGSCAYSDMTDSGQLELQSLSFSLSLARVFKGMRSDERSAESDAD